MANNNSDNGFTLPAPGAETTTGQATTPAGSQFPAMPEAETIMRDFAIGAGIMVVLMVVFFFMKNAFAQSLVKNKRFSPNDAGAASWWLFGFLTTTSAAVLVMILGPASVMVPQVLVGLGVLPLLTLIFTWRSSRG
ncbi:hypothetical protein [Parendozoicomonas haliclonae]|uniref:Uncharacterized protein n=1 Tax=Parendozoicomonas haliclonae TaxID=1960125 RepID=A0A1X7AQ22_9GAMM|nr:hypothetical protein [Parendozoicomonas haliclonae]SMA50198.1 hypothetical protein EHSB41UT_03991 [Parendozoicomonas haliclonae]